LSEAQSVFFSVIIPTHNRARTVVRAIESIVDQIFRNFELIVVDDGGTDTTNEQIANLGLARVKYVRQHNQGVSAARNTGARHATGKYLAFLDDDDRVTQNWLADFSNLIIKHQEPEVLLCGMQVNHPLTGIIEKVLPAVDEKRLVSPGTFAIKKDFFVRIGSYDSRIDFGENTELFIRVRMANPRISYVNNINFYYEQSIAGGSKNLRNKIRSNQIILEKHKEFYKTNKHGKTLLTQLIGVSYLKLHEFDNAKKYLRAALLLKPFNFKSFIRLFLAYLPFISRRIYK
jgi:glycosyltransferase involved in cell wall biosynthesis